MMLLHPNLARDNRAGFKLCSLLINKITYLASKCDYTEIHI